MSLFGRGNGWIGVDLDRTLAEYDEWVGPDHIGPPLMPMVRRVQRWLREGKNVAIFTARVHEDGDPQSRANIEAWCLKHIGQVLPVTCCKDHDMLVLWDDRCVTVEANRGEPYVFTRRGGYEENNIS